MDPQLAFATVASTGLLYTYVSDLRLVTADQPACLKVSNMQRGTITSNSSRPKFAIELISSPGVQTGLNSPTLRRIS